MSGVSDLANHAIRAAEQEAGAKSGRRFAAALSAQCTAFREAAEILERHAVIALIDLADAGEVGRR